MGGASTAVKLGTCGSSDSKETAILGHVIHTDIHTKNGIVWTAARHRAKCQRYLEKSKLIVVGGWLYVLPKNKLLRIN